MNEGQNKRQIDVERKRDHECKCMVRYQKKKRGNDQGGEGGEKMVKKKERETADRAKNTIAHAHVILMRAECWLSATSL